MNIARLCLAFIVYTMLTNSIVNNVNEWHDTMRNVNSKILI